MKKILLATTAVGLFAAATAHAQGPTVTVGGYADFQVGSADQEPLYETSTGANAFSSDLHTRTDTEVYIKVDGKTDNGLGYGAYIELEADVNGDDNATNANNNSERTYLYVESGFGRVEVGATGDAGDALRVDASTFARATGGIGGDFYQYVDLGNGQAAAAGSDYYILPGLPTAVGLTGEADGGAINARATANKISYYSPRIQGLQLGVSYTPDQDERGTADGFSGDGNGGAGTTGIENAWNIGLNYEGEFEGFGIEASAQAEWGNTEDNAAAATTRDDLQAYAFGLAGSYAGFTLGGSYGIIDESSNTATLNTETDYWTVGGAYAFGPFAASVSYFSSEIDNQAVANTDSEFQNLVVGADYQLAPGLVPYIEVAFFETDNNIANTATTVDNEGTVFIVGTELNF